MGRIRRHTVECKRIWSPSALSCSAAASPARSSTSRVTADRTPTKCTIPKGPAQLLGLLARLKYDVIHQHFGGMLTNRILALSLACTSRPGAKSVMTFHSGGYPSTPEGQALRPNSFAGFVLRRFDGLIAVNGEIMSFFQKMRVLPHRARLISPYSFLTEQSPGSLPEPLAAFFAAHDPVLISAGQLEPEYDLPLQIEAMPHIREKFPDAGLVMLGSGSLNDDLGAQNPAAALCGTHIAARRCRPRRHHGSHVPRADPVAHDAL